MWRISDMWRILDSLLYNFCSVDDMYMAATKDWYKNNDDVSFTWYKNNDDVSLTWCVLNLI